MSEDPNEPPSPPTYPVVVDYTMSLATSASVASDQSVPIATSASISSDQPLPVASDRWEDFKQESFLFGLALLIIGSLLTIPSNSFIRGIAGNIVAAGLVVLLFVGLKSLAEWMKKSPNRKIDQLTRRLRLKSSAR